MEAAKPEAEKSPITKDDHREYQRQVKHTFKGDASFKSGKVDRKKFAAAAMDCIDNCPKNGNCDESHKSAAVKHMWDSYRAKHDGVKEGYLIEGWDDTSDEDVKVADAELKKSGKGMSKRAEEALHRKLDKKDKKAEDAASKKKSKEDVQEAVETPEAAPAEVAKGGFAEFLKQK
jgi:hypothetical protein